jgi:hypothetical protein
MLSHLILASSLAGFLVPVIVVVFCKNIDWSKELGAPTWDFTRSWASNITAAGTILSYAALLSCFSPTANLRFFPRPAYLSVGTIAGGLSILAPLAFNVLSRILRACHSGSATSSSFLIGAGITIWGLTMQLFLAACLLRELRAAGILPPVATLLFIFLLLAFSGSLVAYAVLTAADTLKKEKPLALEAREQMVEGQLAVPPPPKTWALL